MDNDLDDADGVAFLLAHLHGDEAAVEALLGIHEDRAAVPGVAVGVLLEILKTAGVDAIALEATLVDWQEQRRGSL